MDTKIQAPGEIHPVEQLRDAINTHDLDALVACFTPDFVSRQPAHPARNFTGNAQVRENWTMILAGVPDLHATLLRTGSSGDTLFAEWEWSGTRRDGAPHEMRGVTVQGTAGGRIAWVNFYMERVDAGEAGVASAIRELTAAPAEARR